MGVIRPKPVNYKQNETFPNLAKNPNHNKLNGSKLFPILSLHEGFNGMSRKKRQ
jgi:hypothetical protein